MLVHRAIETHWLGGQDMFKQEWLIMAGIFVTLILVGAILGLLEPFFMK